MGTMPVFITYQEILNSYSRVQGVSLETCKGIAIRPDRHLLDKEETNGRSVNKTVDLPLKICTMAKLTAEK